MSVRARLGAVAVALGLLALAAGPVLAIIHRPLDSPSAISLFGDPFATPRLATWPTGIYDTVPGGGVASGKATRAPKPVALSVAEAQATAPATGYVAVTGPAAGRPLPGVGAVVTADDVTTLMRMAEPARTDAIRYLTAVDGAALGLVAMGREPTAASRLVDSRSTERRRRLLGSEQEVKEMVDVWAQQRPDLSVLVTPSDGGPGAGSGAGAGAGALVGDVGLAKPAYRPGAAALADEVLTALADSAPVVAPRLFTDRDSSGLFVRDDDSLTPTARGQAWTVAALAVPPGSHAAPVEVTDDLDALVFERTRGGASVLVWNPGRLRTITVDVPDGAGGIFRYEARVAGKALSAVLLKR